MLISSAGDFYPVTGEEDVIGCLTSSMSLSTASSGCYLVRRGGCDDLWTLGKAEILREW